MESSHELKNLQKTELGILHQVYSIFEKYGLRFYLLGGSLLGAVRHEGFIPWDDDIDIGMPRPDYERFLKVAENELEHPYELYTFQNKNRPSALYFTQVVNTDVSVSRFMFAASYNVSAWIDVFPLDGVPESSVGFFFWWNYGMLLSKLFSLSQTRFIYKDAPNKNDLQCKHSKKEKVISLFLRLKLDNFLNPEKLWDRLDRHLKRYDYDTSSRLINFCGYLRKKELFSKDVYGDGRLYKFEDMMVPGPNDYDFVLAQMYGDYMTPPNMDDRNHHNVNLGFKDGIK